MSRCRASLAVPMVLLAVTSCSHQSTSSDPPVATPTQRPARTTASGPDHPPVPPLPRLANGRVQSVDDYLDEAHPRCPGCDYVESIAFDQRTGRLLLAWRSADSLPLRLEVVRAGGSRVDLTCSEDLACPEAGDDWWVAVGPGRGRLSVGGTPGQVVVVDHRGDVRRTIGLPAPLGGDEEVLDATWSPDGSRLAVRTRARAPEADPGRGGIVNNVWLVNPDGGDPRLVHTAEYTGPLRPGDSPLGYIWSLGWSPDGSRLGFIEEGARIGGTEDSQWIRAVSLPVPAPGEEGSGEVTTLYDYPHRPYDSAQLLWSPDGTRVAIDVPGQVFELAADDGRVLARHPYPGGRFDDPGRPPLIWPARLR